MKILKTTLLATLLISSSIAHADWIIGLVVNISNNTDSTCYLLSSSTSKHGYFATENPASIAAYSSDICTGIDSGFKGPDLVLDFDCSGKKISLETSYPMGILSSSGPMQATILHADDGITAVYDATRSEAASKTMEMAYWSIETQSPSHPAEVPPANPDANNDTGEVAPSE